MKKQEPIIDIFLNFLKENGIYDILFKIAKTKENYGRLRTNSFELNTTPIKDWLNPLRWGEYSYFTPNDMYYEFWKPRKHINPWTFWNEMHIKWNNHLVFLQVNSKKNQYAMSEQSYNIGNLAKNLTNIEGLKDQNFNLLKSTALIHVNDIIATIKFWEEKMMSPEANDDYKTTCRTEVNELEKLLIQKRKLASHLAETEKAEINLPNRLDKSIFDVKTHEKVNVMKMLRKGLRENDENLINEAKGLLKSGHYHTTEKDKKGKEVINEGSPMMDASIEGLIKDIKESLDDARNSKRKEKENSNQQAIAQNQKIIDQSTKFTYSESIQKKIEAFAKENEKVAKQPDKKAELNGRAISFFKGLFPKDNPFSVGDVYAFVAWLAAGCPNKEWHLYLQSKAKNAEKSNVQLKAAISDSVDSLPEEVKTIIKKAFDDEKNEHKFRSIKEELLKLVKEKNIKIVPCYRYWNQLRAEKGLEKESLKDINSQKNSKESDPTEKETKDSFHREKISETKPDLWNKVKNIKTAKDLVGTCQELVASTYKKLTGKGGYDWKDSLNVLFDLVLENNQIEDLKDMTEEELLDWNAKEVLGGKKASELKEPDPTGKETKKEDSSSSKTQSSDSKSKKEENKSSENTDSQDTPESGSKENSGDSSKKTQETETSKKESGKNSVEKQASPSGEGSTSGEKERENSSQAEVSADTEEKEQPTFDLNEEEVELIRKAVEDKRSKSGVIKDFKSRFGIVTNKKEVYKCYEYFNNTPWKTTEGEGKEIAKKKEEGKESENPPSSESEKKDPSTKESPNESSQKQETEKSSTTENGNSGSEKSQNGETIVKIPKDKRELYIEEDISKVEPELWEKYKGITSSAELKEACIAMKQEGDWKNPYNLMYKLIVELQQVEDMKEMSKNDVDLWYAEHVLMLKGEDLSGFEKENELKKGPGPKTANTEEETKSKKELKHEKEEKATSSVSAPENLIKDFNKVNTKTQFKGVIDEYFKTVGNEKDGVPHEEKAKTVKAILAVSEESWVAKKYAKAKIHDLWKIINNREFAEFPNARGRK